VALGDFLGRQEIYRGGGPTRMAIAQSTTPAIPDARDDAVTAAALAVIRRALVEGVPVTRTGLAEEAAVTLDASPKAALAEVDDVAQRLGISSLR
jgi:hypothetical protein